MSIVERAAELIALSKDEELTEDQAEAITAVAGALLGEEDPVAARRGIGRLLREIVRAKLECGDGSGEKDAREMLTALAESLDPEQAETDAWLERLVPPKPPAKAAGKAAGKAKG